MEVNPFRPLTALQAESTEARIQQLFNHRIRPFVQKDGGDVEVVEWDVTTKILTVSLGKRIGCISFELESLFCCYDVISPINLPACLTAFLSSGPLASAFQIPENVSAL